MINLLDKINNSMTAEAFKQLFKRKNH